MTPERPRDPDRRDDERVREADEALRNLGEPPEPSEGGRIASRRKIMGQPRVGNTVHNNININGSQQGFAINTSNEGNVSQMVNFNSPTTPMTPEQPFPEALPLDLEGARNYYIETLALRGNIFRRGEAGRVSNRNSAEEESYMREAAHNYTEALTRHARLQVTEHLQALNEARTDEERLRARENLLNALVDEQMAEQLQFDTAVDAHGNHDGWTHFRKQVWNRRGVRGARMGLGLGVVAGSLIDRITGDHAIAGAAALLPGGPAIYAGIRGVLGGIGGALATEALMEKYGPFARKGEADRIANKVVKGKVWQRMGRSIPFFGRRGRREEYQAEMPDRLRQAQEAVDALPDETVLAEIARLQALQVIKASSLNDASGTTGPEISNVIGMLKQRASEIVARRVVEQVDRSRAEVIADALEAGLNAELDHGAEAIREETDKERFRKVVRRGTALVVGTTIGIVAGQRAARLVNPDSHAPIGGKLPSQEISPTPIPEPIPVPATEGIGVVDIPIDERGEGMIRAIAQYLEGRPYHMDHRAAMLFANRAFEHGEIAPGQEMYNLVHGAHDVMPEYPDNDHFSINLGGLTEEQLRNMTVDQINNHQYDNVINNLFHQSDFVHDSGVHASEEFPKHIANNLTRPVGNASVNSSDDLVDTSGYGPSPALEEYLHDQGIDHTVTADGYDVESIQRAREGAQSVDPVTGRPLVEPGSSTEPYIPHDDILQHPPVESVPDNEVNDLLKPPAPVSGSSGILTTEGLPPNLHEMADKINTDALHVEELQQQLRSLQEQGFTTTNSAEYRRVARLTREALENHQKLVDQFKEASDQFRVGGATSTLSGNAPVHAEVSPEASVDANGALVESWDLDTDPEILSARLQDANQELINAINSRDGYNHALHEWATAFAQHDIITSSGVDAIDRLKDLQESIEVQKQILSPDVLVGMPSLQQQAEVLQRLGVVNDPLIFTNGSPEFRETLIHRALERMDAVAEVASETLETVQ